MAATHTHTPPSTHIDIGGIDVVISIRVGLREDHSVLVICEEVGMVHSLGGCVPAVGMLSKWVCLTYKAVC